jgi:CDP-diacylglycerol--glycerol-3-phosphate 3-phosphatidyltransferase
LLQHISNIITTIRLILAFVFIYLFAQADLIVESSIIFVIAAVSDFFDGWIARKLKISSKFGEQFDPLADKVLTLSAFFAFAIEGIIPFWCVITIAIRDIANTIIRFIFLSKKNIPTSTLAKFKTAIQLVFISIILFIKLLTIREIAPEYYYIINSPIIFYAMLVITIITVWTMIEYIIQIIKRK